MYSSVLRSLTARRTAHYYDFLKSSFLAFSFISRDSETWASGKWSVVFVICKFMLIILWSINTCKNYFYLQMTSPSLQCFILLLTLTGPSLRPY